MKIKMNDFKFMTGFVMVLVGARRSGKSTLIKELLNGPFKKRFKPENIFIICQSLEFNDDFKEYSLARKFHDADPSIIQAIIDEQTFVIKNYGKKRTPEILLILDDTADSNLMNFNGVCDMIAVRGRHILISIVCTTQRLSAVSRTIRLNADYLIFFSPYNLSELEQFIEQYVLKQDRREIMKKISETFEEPYQFIFVDNSEKSQKKKLKIGWDKLLVEK